MIELKNIHKYYNPGSVNELCLFQNFSLTIQDGDFVAVVGSNGSGKTSMLNIICGSIPIDSGDIVVNGISIVGKKDFLRHRKIGRVYQDPSKGTCPSMTILENLSIADNKGKPYNLGRGVNKARIDAYRELLAELNLGLEDKLHTQVGALSGGQRQRIGIARALVMQPEFIIADEPISALDVSIRAQIINLLNELKKEHSLTYLFIAHDLSVVRFISDRIGVIYKGALMELAPGEEIFAHPLHPYTRSLLSAIPIPDPASERGKTCTPYDPSVHDYSVDKPAWTEIAPGHFVFANARECDEYRRMLG